MQNLGELNIHEFYCRCGLRQRPLDGGLCETCKFQAATRDSASPEISFGPFIWLVVGVVMIAVAIAVVGG
ncbi:MAG: hypothetical protein KF855_03215 [Acidobacteria bacterium]|nr:hypothetical protein [Acidobacteriota bacterium]